VTSWHAGEKRTYVCYRQDGLPRVNHVSTEPCGTDTGIEVRVPLTRASGSYSDWYEQAGRLFRWWPTKPRCNVDVPAWNFSPDTAAFESGQRVDGGPAWTVRDTQPDATIVMGNVPYRLDFNSLPDLPTAVKKVMAGVWLAIRVPMGSVAISPSREALSYDPATVKYLTLRLAEILRDLKQVVEADIANQPTLAAARQYLHASNGINRGIVMSVLKDQVHLTWQGRAINAKESIDRSTIAPAGTTPKLFDYTRHAHWSNFRREPYDDNNTILEHTFSRYKNTRWVVMWVSKVTAATYAKLKHDSPMLSPREDVKLTVVSGVPYQDFCDLCEKRGIPMPVNIDTDLAAPPSTAAAPTSSAPKTRGYVFNDANDYSYDRTTSPINLAGGGIYLEFTLGEPVANYVRALRSLRTIGFLGVSMNPRVIGVSTAELNRSKTLQANLAKHGWVRFDPDWVAANVPEAFIEEHYKAGAALTWLSQGMSPRRAIIEKATWKGLDPVLKIVRPYFKRSYDYHRYGEHIGLDVMLSAGQSKAKERGRNVGYQLAAEWKKFLDIHPMLHHINFQNVPEGILNDYINR